MALIEDSPIAQIVLNHLREELEQMSNSFIFEPRQYGSNLMFNLSNPVKYITMDIDLVCSDNQYYVTQLSKLETFY
jgi:hypothetical protein